MEKLTRNEQRTLAAIQQAPRTTDRPSKSVDSLLEKGLIQITAVPTLYKRAYVPAEGYVEAVSEELIGPYQKSLEIANFLDTSVRLRHLNVLFEELQELQTKMIEVKVEINKVVLGHYLPLRKGDVIKVEPKGIDYIFDSREKDTIVVTLDGSKFFLQARDIYSINDREIV